MRYCVHSQTVIQREIEVTATTIEEARLIANEMPEGAWTENERTYTEQVHPTHDEDWMASL